MSQASLAQGFYLEGLSGNLAEREGFEPSIQVLARITV